MLDGGRGLGTKTRVCNGLLEAGTITVAIGDLSIVGVQQYGSSGVLCQRGTSITEVYIITKIGDPSSLSRENKRQVFKRTGAHRCVPIDQNKQCLKS